MTQTRSPRLNRLCVVLLSLGLGLFLADAVVSLVDDSLILLFDIRVLAVIRGILFILAMLMTIVIYALMGLTPAVPKRLFLPLTLFMPLAELLALPFLIYFSRRMQWVTWGVSFCQVCLGLGLLHAIRGGFEFRWPLVPDHQLGNRRFTWLNLSTFLLANFFLLAPAILVYLVVCTSLAVDHFSEGFLAVRPEGLMVRVKTYVRPDGKTIRLVPMSHIGETEFYRHLSQSFPTNALILVEGVTDNRHLLTNKISYKRMATSLGVAEQQNEFKPPGDRVRADVDVEQFTTNTIAFLNLVMLMHTQGLKAETVLMFMQLSSPHFEEQLVEDLLKKRNRRLLEELQARLPQVEYLIVPWGAAHIPEIAKAIQQSGFRVNETQEYVAIRFRSVWK